METETQQQRVIIGAFVEPPLKRALERKALLSERSMSAEIRVALRAHLGLPAEEERPAAETT